MSNSWAFRDCPHCGLRDAHMQSHDMIEAQSANGSRRWWPFTCPRCGGLVALEDDPEWEIDEPLSVMPEVTSSKYVVGDLPPDVERYYLDAQTVLAAGVPDAAGVQLRKTLEAAVAKVGIEKAFPLANALKELREKGLITESFFEVTSHVRKLGNVGAHAGDETISLAEAEQALSFTMQLLRNLFEIPAQLAALKEDLPEP